MSADLFDTTEPLPVQVIRTNRSLGSQVIWGVIFFPLYAWAIMLLTPFVTPWAPSYWQALAAYVLIRIAIPAPTMFWSTQRSGGTDS